MAAVLKKKDPAAFASQVDEQLAQATSRIRAHDLIFGALVLVSLVLIYATAMVVLDKVVVLPEWVRQVSLLGFVAILAGAAYGVLARPLMKRINPLYAAKQVERTIDDNKNSVTGYVDAQEKGDLNPTVKAALANRAAQAAAEADVNRAVNHRSLMIAGGVAIAFLLTLIVLFFVFRPAQFASHLNRTFIPFSSAPPKAQTELTLVKPEPLDPTITNKQPITIAVHVDGKIPKANTPQQVRLMIRHNLENPDYDVLPMQQGDTERDFQLRVPDYLVSNGFWYKVAGGDAETEEHRVTVRAVPMFTEFDKWQVTYEYPKYLRWKPETANDPNVRAYRGTNVTMIARTNRDVRDGLMVIEPGNTRVPGVPVPGQPKSLQFAFKVTEPGRYKLTFTSTEGETTPDMFTASIKVDVDQPPQLDIKKPEEDETQVPANGQIMIDGKIGDDFGIDTVTLKMKIVEPANLQRELKDVPYLNGKERSFLRTKDNTYPTDLQYKGSVDLTKLTDAAGLDPKLQPDMVIEYWLEATDNCTEPKANVGRSVVKRVRLTPPVMEPEDKQRLDDQKQNRQNEENQHNQQQKQKNDTENRESKQQEGKPQPKEGEPKKNEGEPKKGEGNPNNAEGKQGEPNADSKKGGMQPNKGMNDPNMMPNTNKAPEPRPSDPKQNPDKKNPPDPKMTPDPNGMGMDMGNPMPNPMNDNPKPGDNGKAPPKQDPQELEKTAKEFKDKIDQENKDGGSAKPNNEPKQDERTNPGDAKPQPKDGMGGDKGANASEPKPQPKQPDNMDPMGKNDKAPSESKNEGKLEKGADPATAKPEQPKQADGMNGQKNSEPSENRGEPLGAPPGADKEPPKEPQPAQKDPSQKQDPKSGSTAKSSTEKKQDDNTAGMPNTTEKKDPAGEAGTGPKPPMREPTRGDDKPTDKPKGAPPADKPDGDKNAAGDAKPQKAPDAGATKPKPSDDMMNQPMGGTSETKPENDANDPKKPNQTGAAEAKPDDKQQPMGAGDKTVEKGMDKPQKNDKDNRNASGNNTKQPNPEELKKLEEAAKDLNSPDPKKREDAQKKLDKAIGEQNRKDLENLQKDLKSDDPMKRADAEKKLQDLKDKMKNATADGKQPEKNDQPLTEEQKKELADAAKDLNNPDPKKREDAQKKLDKAIGEQNRKELEQLQKDLNSPDENTKKAAQKEAEEIMKNANAGKQPADKKDQPPLTEEQKKELADAAKDLNNPDPKKREDAQKKLDKAVGEDNRKELEKLQKDLNSPDENTKKAAQKEAEEIMKNAGNQDKKDAPQLSEKEMKELADAVKDLNNPDPKKREDAQKKLDKAIGEDKRKEFEQLAKDLKSDDKNTREAAEKKLDDLKKQIEKEQAKKDGKEPPKGKEPSPEEIADLMKKADDLNSKDDKKREQAEKDLDEKIGKANREKLQEEMKNKKPNPEKQANDLKKKMEDWQQGPGSGVKNTGPMDDDKKNRAKTAELNLIDFEKEEYRKKLQSSKGWTDAEYEKFLEDYRKYVEGLKNEAVAGDKLPPAPGPKEKDTGMPFASPGSGQVERTGPGTPGITTNGGPTNAPPGFDDARKRFQDAIKNKKP